MYTEYMLNWILFTVLSVLAYVCISAFGQFGGEGSTSVLGAALSTFKPLPLVLLILGNIFWSTGVYLGLRNTSDVIPIALSIGVLTSFIYSAVFLGSVVTGARILGVAVVLFGIYLLR